ncbi:hypothetical protein M9Y10_022679 [Tritrichomonas musculus]|uniref:Importin N-terminal domain-containing protein n=1 Tax=Tritrichomonas musculus TaxID=1915356 RepID=A0ABR2KWA8_9EUKA
MEQHIIQLIEDLNSTSPEKNNAAAQELFQIFPEPMHFPCFLQLLRTNENSYTRKFVLILIGRFISTIYNVDNQYILPLIETLINIIQNDPDFESRFHSCKVIAKLSNNRILHNLDDIIDIFLQDENLIPFVFFILEDAYSSLNNFEKYDKRLIELFEIYISSPDLENQKIAKSFFLKFIPNIDDSSLLDDPNFIDIICKSLITSIQQNNIKSTEYLTDVACIFLDLISDPNFAFINKYSNILIELAFNCINDNSIPILIRVVVHQIFEKIDFIPLEKIFQIISLSIKMSCEMCSDENIDSQYDYRFNYDFFCNVLCDEKFKSNGDSFNFFFSFIQNLLNSNNINFIQVSIYLFDVIIDCYSHLIDIIKDPLIQTIQIGLNQPSESIIDDTFELVNKVMKKRSYTLTPLYNNIITYFMTHEPLKYNFVFSAFCSFLENLPESPPNLNEIINFCTKSYQIHDSRIRYFSICCLQNALYYYRPQDESGFSLIPIDLMLKDEENITAVFEMIGNLIKAFPINIKSMIQNIINIINQTLQNNYYELDKQICFLIRKLIEYYPSTMNNFVEQIQSIISFVYSFVYENNQVDWENPEETEMFFDTQGQHLLLVASTYKFYGINYEMLMRIFDELIYIESNDYANIAVQTIAEKIDTQFFLAKTQIDSLAIAKIIMINGVGNASDEILQHILSTISKSEEFNDDVFILINMFLNCGQNLRKPIIEEIQKRSVKQDFIHQGWALLSLAYIAHFNNDQNEIFNLLQYILQIINTNDLNQKILLIRAINVILIYHQSQIQIPNEIAQVAQNFFNDSSATSDMKNECILTLLLLNPQLDVNYAQNLLSNLSLDIQSETTSFLFLESIKQFSSIIVQYYANNKEAFEDSMIKITLYATTSETYAWLQIRSEVRNFMKQFMSNFSEEWLINSLRHNENKMIIFQKNINIE